MRKVGTRRVWNFVNAAFGDKILPGKKHVVFAGIESLIVDFNDHAFHTIEDLSNALAGEMIACFAMSEKEIGEAMDSVAQYMNDCYVAGRKH